MSTKHNYHKEILALIKQHASKATQHTFLDSYLGNSHPRYPISAPVLRKIARTWMKEHNSLSLKDFTQTINDLILGPSATEKWMAGILLDYATPEQRKFSSKLFDGWLEHVEGWAEIDALCSSKYSGFEIINQWAKWKPLLLKFSKSKNINKRRASLVFFCGPLRRISNMTMAHTALTVIDRLKGEHEILITKAISWLLRTMVKHHRDIVEDYLRENRDTLPRIAYRETMVKLATGRKTKKKRL